MDSRRRAALATFFADDSLAVGLSIVLSDEAAHHARVRRLQRDDAVRLTNGRGLIATGTLRQLGRETAEILIDDVTTHVHAPYLGLFVPVADRDRMLWLAEKSAELGISSWQPVVFRRSMSVSPRGEGEKFRQKIRSRMISALEQSGGAWLPELRQEIPLAEALVRTEEVAARKLLLERGGAPLVSLPPEDAVIMIGPEGGIDDDERTLIVDEHRWLPVSLGEATLRFETAGVVAAGLVRAAHAARR